MSNPKKILCLLIEDDLDDIEIFQMALEDISVKVEVLSHRSCLTALKFLEEDALVPHCIFLSYLFLLIEDTDWITKIQAIEKVSKTPLVLLAADPALTDERNFKGRNIAEVIYKGTLKKYSESLDKFFVGV